MSRSQYQFTLQGPDTDGALPVRRTSMEDKIRDLPGFQDVTSDLQMKNPQVNVEIDRDKASATGVTADADRRRPLQRLRLPADLHHLTPNNQYQVILELEAEYQQDPTALSTALRPRHERPAGAAEHAGPRHHRRRPAVDQPLRASCPP